LLALGSGPVVAVGYSMGGPVAQLLWRRHRDLVDGLVFCATTAGFFPERRARLSFQAATLAMVAAARAGARTGVLNAPALVPVPSGGMSLWAAAEMRRHDWRMIIEAGHSISTYHGARWIHEIDVPTSVVCTTEDRGVVPELQLATAEAIPGATVHEFRDGHFACANPNFAEPLLRACCDVAARTR
jgi:3-oxoadipate enol-lactonase